MYMFTLFTTRDKNKTKIIVPIIRKLIPYVKLFKEMSTFYQSFQFKYLLASNLVDFPKFPRISSNTWSESASSHFHFLSKYISKLNLFPSLRSLKPIILYHQLYCLFLWLSFINLKYALLLVWSFLRLSDRGFRDIGGPTFGLRWVAPRSSSI